MYLPKVKLQVLNLIRTGGLKLCFCLYTILYTLYILYFSVLNSFRDWSTRYANPGYIIYLFQVSSKLVLQLGHVWYTNIQSSKHRNFMTLTAVPFFCHRNTGLWYLFIMIIMQLVTIYTEYVLFISMASLNRPILYRLWKVSGRRNLKMEKNRIVLFGTQTWVQHNKIITLLLGKWECGTLVLIDKFKRTILLYNILFLSYNKEFWQ